MRAVLQYRDEHLVVGLEGEADAHVAPLVSDCEVFLAIDDQIELFDPRALVVDFRDLRYIDSHSLASLLVELSRYAIARCVRCVGPGPALRRLASLFSADVPIAFAASVQDAISGSGGRLECGEEIWTKFLEGLGFAVDASWSLARPARIDLPAPETSASESDDGDEAIAVPMGGGPEEDDETGALPAAQLIAEPARNEIVIDSEREAAYLLGQSRPATRVNPLHRPIEFQRKGRPGP